MPFFSMLCKRLTKSDHHLTSNVALYGSKKTLSGVHTNRLEIFGVMADISISRIASLPIFVLILAFIFGKHTSLKHHTLLEGASE